MTSKFGISTIISICFKGTGKTRTLVIAISKIVSSTNNCILVTSNANGACDEITLRLLQFLSPSQIFRLYAKSFNQKQLNEKIKPISNYKQNDFHFPSLEYLYSYRVVVCTLATASCLVRARGKDKNYDSSHFSHILIDEAACVHEPMLMVSIAGKFKYFFLIFSCISPRPGFFPLFLQFIQFIHIILYYIVLGLCTELRQIKSAIILAGDPKQLDPVTESQYAKKIGYNISYMEYLCNKPCYQQSSGKYNSKFIVKLTKNYRSHSVIINLPCELFYEGTLEGFAHESKIIFAIIYNNFKKMNSY